MGHTPDTLLACNISDILFLLFPLSLSLWLSDAQRFLSARSTACCSHQSTRSSTWLTQTRTREGLQGHQQHQYQFTAPHRCSGAEVVNIMDTDSSVLRCEHPCCGSAASLPFAPSLAALPTAPPCACTSPSHPIPIHACHPQLAIHPSLSTECQHPISRLHRSSLSSAHVGRNNRAQPRLLAYGSFLSLSLSFVLNPFL